MTTTETKPTEHSFSVKAFAEAPIANMDAKPTAQFFSLKTQLLAQGRLNKPLARTALMHLTTKVYASGGENAMHQHPCEDHAFIVLQGQATFRIETDDNVKVVDKNEGVMIPKGVNYWFLSSAPENLVMLRVGAAENWPDNWRAFPDGRPFVGLEKENKKQEQVLLPGQFFAG